MRSFRIAGNEFESSLALDASIRENTTVTVAVETPSRGTEVELLESICKSARKHSLTDFRLFNRKARDFGVEGNEGFFRDVIKTNRKYITGYHHVIHGNETNHEVESVHSALLLDSLLDPYEDRLVIVDGGEQKARPVVNSLSGLRDAIPSVTHCLKSEYYYPQCLLADLSAFYVSCLVNENEYNHLDPFFDAPSAEHTEELWGKAFAGMKQSKTEYRVLDLLEMIGDSPRERAKCWYHGGMARSGGEHPATNSVTPLLKHASKKGYDNLKAELERL